MGGVKKRLSSSHTIIKKDEVDGETLGELTVDLLKDLEFGQAQALVAYRFISQWKNGSAVDKMKLAEQFNLKNKDYLKN